MADGYDPSAIEPRWQEEWRRGEVQEADGPGVYVLVRFPAVTGSVDLDHVRSYAIADAYVRFLRARGVAVLFPLGFEAFGTAPERGAGEVPLREWVAQSIERMRADLGRLGFSFDRSRGFSSADPEVYRWSQELFLELLEAGLVVEREGSVAWCERCSTVLAPGQVHGNRCGLCDRAVSLTRRRGWYLRTSHLNEEAEQRLDDLDGWDDAAIEQQRAALGRVDGVELDAGASDGATLTLFTPHPEAVLSGELALLSPNHPDLDRWAGDPGVREALAALRDGGWRTDPGRIEALEVVDTGRFVVAPELDSPLPVVISHSVDARFGPTAALGIPAEDPVAAAILGRLEHSPGLSIRGGDERLVTRTATRYRASDLPISRPGPWGAPVPIVRCDACGIVAVARERLPVRLPDDLAAGTALAERADFVECACPACGRPARRETETLDPRFDAAWQELLPAVPAVARTESPFDHAELGRWLPVARQILGEEDVDGVLDRRLVAALLHELGHLDFLDEPEPIAATLTHGVVREHPAIARRRLRHPIDPADLVAQSGADALRFALLFAAGPARSFLWEEHVLGLARAFLERAWTYAEPRLAAAAAVPVDARIDESDWLRRRLAAWCGTAVERITVNLERGDMHRVTRNLMHLFERIESFEARRLAREQTLSDADREAVVVALRIFLRLLAPVSPHLAEELWARSGCARPIVSAGWPG